jgi:uncharacterized surface protein with fasciclin (FAS1) repeats
MAAYLFLRDGREPAERTEPADPVATPPSSPLPSTPESSAEPTVENHEEPGEGSSPDPTTPTPTPVSTKSLCPFLPSGSDPGSPQDLADETADAAIDTIPVLSVFAAAMHATGFDAQLRKASGVTILAPTDDAFAADISEDELENLLIKRHGDLQQLLESHVLGKEGLLASLVAVGGASALSGDRVTFAASGGGVRISDDANVICSDLRARNATIHIIDSVLGRIQLTEPQEEKG